VCPCCKGLHSTTFPLDVSTFQGTRWVIAVTKTAQVELRSGRVEAPAVICEDGAAPTALQRLRDYVSEARVEATLQPGV